MRYYFYSFCYDSEYDYGKFKMVFGNNTLMTEKPPSEKLFQDSANREHDHITLLSFTELTKEEFDNF